MESTSNGVLDLIMRAFDTVSTHPWVEQACAWNWKGILATGLGVYVVSKIASRLYKRRIALGKIRCLQERIGTKTLALVDRLSRESGSLVTSERLAIVHLPVEELLTQLRKGQLKPLQVLEAFQARAMEITREHNCVCEFIIEAEEWARELEQVPEDRRGPLHGLPMSIKECFFVRGHDVTVGLSRFIGQPVPSDCAFVDRLKRLGAVPFCRTNIPQTMKSYGCSNPVYGVTTNPWDKTRSPGGSSGGEACLIALNGSPLGIGSDVGGSLRTPAHFCGVVGLKPTTGRIYQLGRRQGSEGHLIGINSNAGFMSKDVSGVALGMKLLLADPYLMSDVDHKVVPVPWNPRLEEPKRKLKVGWYLDCPKLPISPGCQRAVHVTTKLLKDDGHTIVPFKLKHLQELYFLYFDHILADDGVNAMAWLEGDIVDKSIELNYLAWSSPRFLRNTVLAWLVGLRSRSTAIYATRGCIKTSQLWRTVKRLSEITAEILADLKEQEIDILIGPGFAFPAPPEAHPSKLVTAVPVPGIYNLLDFPAGVLPITSVSETDQKLLPGTYTERDETHDLVRDGIKGAVGLPIGVQVIGKPWQEELVIHTMREIERLRDQEGLFKLPA